MTTGCWVITGITDPRPTIERLGHVCAGATAVALIGSRRTWFTAAGVKQEGEEAFGPMGVVAPDEQRLPFSSGTLTRLTLAALTDAPAPFCRELRIYARRRLLVRWLQPVAGELRLHPGAPTGAVAQLAMHVGARMERRRDAL